MTNTYILWKYSNAWVIHAVFSDARIAINAKNELFKTNKSALLVPDPEKLSGGKKK